MSAHILKEKCSFLDIFGAHVMCHFYMKATSSVVHNVAASCTMTHFIYEYVHLHWGYHTSGDHTTITRGIIPLAIIPPSLGASSLRRLYHRHWGCQPSSDHISDARELSIWWSYHRRWGASSLRRLYHRHWGRHPSGDHISDAGGELSIWRSYHYHWGNHPSGDHTTIHWWHYHLLVHLHHRRHSDASNIGSSKVHQCGQCQAVKPFESDGWHRSFLRSHQIRKK
jgi:hypothetical protein